MKRKLALLAAAVMAAAVLPMADANAATTYVVHLGAEVPHGFSVRAFAPLDHGIPTINVAKNDVIDFNAGGVFLLPADEGPLEFASENMIDLDSPFGVLLSDPDPDLEQPFPTDAAYKFNLGPNNFVPDCGASAADPCAFDGSDFFNSGARDQFEGHLFVEITANPGTTLWAIPPNGVPSRRATLKINVVATGVDTQAFIDDAYNEQLTEEQDSAAALNAKLQVGTTRHKVGGHYVYDAYAGYDTPTFALFDMYPAKLNIHVGDKVRWHFSQLTIEMHGLAFPFEKSVAIANEEGGVPVCDPDGDSGPGPDTFDVDFETFTCPSGSGDLEFDLLPVLLDKSGNGKYSSGKDVENSGLRGQNVPTAPGIVGGEAPYDLTFTEPSDSKGYQYACTFHGAFMNARVRVKK